ncbi:hypothetical protein PDESU_02855 [Pontiella desulfatans]|uniref:Lipocalin-like domain-containing protein n=2 Tax=Pontiella desulfatans TaxID=2750659 RepID=A0A6C2U4G6_PONDE|nr:hypothetical protein PDESU_02855 [Pontiella desulfatans]
MSEMNMWGARRSVLAMGVAMVCSVFLMSGCGGDDDGGGGGGDNSDLVGTWELTKLEVGSTTYDFPNAKGYYQRTILSADGMFTTEANFYVTDVGSPATDVVFHSYTYTSSAQYEVEGNDRIKVTVPGKSEIVEFTRSGNTITSVAEGGWTATYVKQ